jgi:hypothetical protein
MIGVGIVGCNYGRTVLIPAFRHDPRCEVVALAGTDAARTAGLARAANVARGFGGWQAIGRGTYHRGRDRGTAENPAECTQASGGHARGPSRRAKGLMEQNESSAHASCAKHRAGYACVALRFFLIRVYQGAKLAYC